MTDYPALPNTKLTVTFADLPMVPMARKNVPVDGGRLIANVRNDITVPYYSGTMVHADDTLLRRGGGKGLKIYDEIERDTHAYAVLQKRKHELVGREWDVEAASDDDGDVEVAEFCRAQFKRLPFDRMCLELLDANLKGFAVSETMWARDGGWIVPSAIISHDQRRFTFDVDWNLRLLTRENMLEGEKLPDRKFIVHRRNVKGNNPYGLGLGTILFWPVLFKKEGYAFWLVFLEKYASPTPVAKVPTMLPKEQRELLLSLEQLAQKNAITVPLGTELSFLEATRSAPHSYEAWSRYWDEQISETVLGETLSTNIGSVGSMAAAQVHTESKSQIIDADGDLLSDTLQDTLLKWMVELNFPGRAVPRVYRRRPKNEKAIAEARKAMAEADDAQLSSLSKIIQAASSFETEETVRGFITGFSAVEGLDDDVVQGLIELAMRISDDSAMRGTAITTLLPAPILEPKPPAIQIDQQVSE